MRTNHLQTGDHVVHPMYGVGVMEGISTRRVSGQTTDCYSVRLREGSVLSVPVACATTLGLRPIANSLATIVACLRSKPRPLPDDDRQRATELKTRSHAPQPAALSEALRDLLNRSLTHSLNSADKSWLASACEHLSAEAALVDAIDSSQARAAIQGVVDQFKSIAAPRSTQQGRPASHK